MNVADGTRLHARDDRILIAEHGDHEDVALGLPLGELADQSETVAIGQRQVGEQNISGVVLEPGSRRRERSE